MTDTDGMTTTTTKYRVHYTMAAAGGFTIPTWVEVDYRPSGEHDVFVTIDPGVPGFPSTRQTRRIPACDILRIEEVTR